MQESAGRFTGRDRTPNGGLPRPKTPSRLPVRPGAPFAADAAPRGRGRRARLDVHLAATIVFVGFTASDEALVESSRDLIAAEIDNVARKIERHLLSHAETSSQFTGDDGRLNRERLARRRESLRDWLDMVVTDPLDEYTARRAGAFGLEYVRPDVPAANRIKARYLVSLVTRVQSLFSEALACSLYDRAEAARHIAAWNKRLMIHLDLLLAVYSSAESSAHWY